MISANTIRYLLRKGKLVVLPINKIKHTDSKNFEKKDKIYLDKYDENEIKYLTEMAIKQACGQ